MPETLIQFDAPIRDNGAFYYAKACGRQREEGLWEGWIEFENVSSGEVVRTSRETTQPNRAEIAYWAIGLTPVYLEGALKRTLVRQSRQAAPLTPPAFGESADAVDAVLANAVPEPILDAFSVYRKSPDLLAQELTAFRAWHLRQIIRGFKLVDEAEIRIDMMTEPELAALIVKRVGEIVGNARHAVSGVPHR